MIENDCVGKIMLSICLEFFKLLTLSSIYLNGSDTKKEKSLKHVARLQQTRNPPVSIARHQLC